MQILKYPLFLPKVFLDKEFRSNNICALYWRGFCWEKGTLYLAEKFKFLNKYTAHMSKPTHPFVWQEKRRGT